MSDGIRVEVRVDEPTTCPIIPIAEQLEEPITEISWSGIPDAEEVIEEFTTEGEQPVIDDDRIQTVFETDGRARHRFTRDRDRCVCQRIEELGSPVETVRLTADALIISFYVLTVEEVSEILTTLRAEFDDVSLQRLHKADSYTDGHAGAGDLVWVDRDTLTDRQREVLETAHEMGYFDYPRRSNATEIAESLEIAPSTFTEHLTAAQSKLLTAILTTRG